MECTASETKSKSDNKSNDLYHERQVRAMCAMHALNNLFQKQQTFTKKDLDTVCKKLSPDTLINPHRSLLGLGNYDVNVLMAAIQEKGYETVWFDKRKNVNILLPDNIMGFILNTPSGYKFGPIRLALHSKHWVAIRKLNGTYMNLDSKLAKPDPIGNVEDLRDFLRSELDDGEKELLLVVEKEVHSSDGWKVEEEDGGENDSNSATEDDKIVRGKSNDTEHNDKTTEEDKTVNDTEHKTIIIDTNDHNGKIDTEINR